MDWQTRSLERWYHSRPNWVGGTTQFHNLISSHLPGDKEVLELGPGVKSRTTAFLRGRYSAVDGLDVDEDAKQNADLRRVYIYDGGRWPFRDESYDGVVADYVLEHLSDPRTVLAEAYRVLRPAGLLFFRTPNLWHYTTLVSALSPHGFHRLVANRLRNAPPGAHDPYPTCYRMNRRGTIRSLLREAGFTQIELLLIEKEPSYGMSSRLLFMLFMAYERIVNSTALLAMFRANLLGVFRKPSPPEIPHSAS